MSACGSVRSVEDDPALRELYVDVLRDEGWLVQQAGDGVEALDLVAAGSPPCVVVLNLVDNAVKYSPGGGEVLIEVADEGGHATVSVTDNGIGIPGSELGGIFEPYRRGSNASMLRGIALGLAGCRAVLEQLGGELTVESTEGVGSTFRVRLPRR